MPRPEQPTPLTGEFLTAVEVANLLRTTPVNVVRLCRSGELPATKPLGTWLIAKSDLASHIAANSNVRGAA